MSIKLKDYDFAPAKERLRSRVRLDRRVVYRWNETLDEGSTKYIRDLDREYSSAPEGVASSLLSDLSILPAEYGGTVVQVEGGYAANPALVTLDLPLVRALMVLRGHPKYPGFDYAVLHRPEQPASHPAVDIRGLLEDLYVSDPQPWSLERFEQTLLDGAREFCGDLDVEPEWTPDMIYPGSHVGRFMWPLAKSTVFDAIGGFDPAFTRRDALVGEWWLLQPVSPRLSMHHLALKFGLENAGILPPNHVDVPGRVVMACFPTAEITDAHRVSLIEDSKFVAGWKKVMWTRGHAPLDDPDFDFVQPEGVTEDSYGPYRHSSELPPWSR
ncbi:MAG: hypothetical protein ABI678_00285 [Kofleriaceae bacterium]